MNIHRKRAIGGVAVPVFIGTTGVIKLGHLHWGVLAVMVLLAAWVYRSMQKAAGEPIGDAICGQIGPNTCP